MAVLEAERQAHSLASVYSSDDAERHRHNGVVIWISEVIDGLLETNYAGQARDRLGLSPPDPEAITGGGTPWMELDSIDTEEAL